MPANEGVFVHQTGVASKIPHGEQKVPAAVKQHTKWSENVPVNTSIYGNKPDDVSEEEWRMRVDLAAVYRQCYRQGLCEGINNHLTAMIPGTRTFLVFPFGLLWNEVTASSLLVVDESGNVLRGKGEPEATAFYIHAALHLKHPRATAVMHTHQSWASALCALKEPTVQMVHQNSCRFYKDVAYDEYNGLVLDHAEGDRLAEVMQEKRVLMHQNHGVIICAESVASCFDRLYYLERACKVQVLAMGTGQPLNIVGDKVCQGIKDGFVESGVHDVYAQLHLEALKRDMLTNTDKGFLE